MKKLIAILILIATLVSVSVIAVSAAGAESSAPQSGENNSDVSSTMAALFNKYYNEGIYTRCNQNFLTDNEAVQGMYVGAVRLDEKYTFFEGNKLWMDNNSGYKGVDIATPTQHFKFVGGVEKDDWTMTGVHFYTLKWFLEEGTGNWTENNVTGIYTSTDENNLEAALGFIASCFKNDGDKALELAKVTVAEEGDSLVFTLYAEEDTNGLLLNEDKIIAKAIITKGIDRKAEFLPAN